MVKRVLLTWCASMVVVVAGVAAPSDKPEKKERVLTVFAVYATPLEEPWNTVIHQALLGARDKGQIRYAWQDQVKPADMEKVLRKQAESGPDVLLGDAAECLEAVQRLAGDFPKIAFVFGSAKGERQPNLSIFDNALHEPAYLCGLIAGKMTRSNVLGVVAGVPEADSNRNINAFIQGARAVNAQVKVKVAFIHSWYDPAKAKQEALQQIAAGADLLYAERAGVIEAARDQKVLAFGNMVDQNALAPDTVVTGTIWDMTPVVEHVLSRLRAGKYQAEDLRTFSTLAKGGARLADWHGWDRKLPADVLRLVKDKEAALKAGKLTLDVSKDQPKSD